MSWTLQSTAFESGQRIPVRYSGDGEDLSPALAWTEVPEGTRELALIVDDPDAPTPEPWVHWVLYKIPAATIALAAGVPTTRTVTNPSGALQGKNSWGKVGYGGPAPPKGHGVHHYHFKLYALDAVLPLEAGLDKRGLLEALEGHVLAEAELVGTYQR
ncbi:MAG: YbhB/YbcL family Raf kinase inhibitor-like protein [Candidatus Krumholzibacteriia bacterium]